MTGRFTVRARITVMATLVVLVVLVVAGAGLVAQQRRLLTESLDEGLEQRADELGSGEAPSVLTGLGEDDAAGQVVRDGVVVSASANIAGAPPIVALPDGTARDITTIDHLPHEESAFRVLVDATGEEVVIVAAPLDDIDDSTSTLIRSLLLGIPIVVAVLAAWLWWLVGRTLAPVESIRAEVAAIGGRDLDRRVPTPPGDDEVARLARTMNGMLDRIEDAAQRQRSFVADASHELRSPLTRIRSELEVDLAHPDRADLLATHASVLDETIGLQRLADDLLLIARHDDGDPGGDLRRPVDLDDLIVRVARRLRADDRVRVDLGAVGAGQVVGDPDALARLVGNLADNAVRHAGTTVAFSLTEGDGAVVLTVEDDGPGIAAADAERIFDRFSRLDGHRRASDGGTGLGLAIARDIAERHGGTLTADPAATGARFVLTLPAA